MDYTPGNTTDVFKHTILESLLLRGGINTYVESLIMDDTYGTPGSYVDFLGIDVTSPHTVDLPGRVAVGEILDGGAPAP